MQENPSSLSTLMQKVIQQIDEYFHHKRREFSFPIRSKGTDFQVKSEGYSTVFPTVPPWPMSRWLRSMTMPKW